MLCLRSKKSLQNVGKVLIKGEKAYDYLLELLGSKLKDRRT
jgi:hypothetical protein